MNEDTNEIERLRETARSYDHATAALVRLLETQVAELRAAHEDIVDHFDACRDDEKDWDFYDVADSMAEISRSAIS